MRESCSLHKLSCSKLRKGIGNCTNGRVMRAAMLRGCERCYLEEAVTSIPSSCRSCLIDRLE